MPPSGGEGTGKDKYTPNCLLPAFYCSNFSKFVIQDNILFKKTISGPSELPILYAVIPPSLVRLILNCAHDSIFGGHP